MHELLATNHPVVVLVHLLENLLDRLLRVGRALQEEGDFVVGNAARVVDVEVGEGLLEVFLAEGFLEFEASHDKLGEVDVAGAVGVDDPHEQTHPVFGDGGLGLEGSQELEFADDSVVVAVEFFEDLGEDALFLSGHELGDDEGVHHRFQLVLELSIVQLTLKLPICSITCFSCSIKLSFPACFCSQQ